MTKEPEFIKIAVCGGKKEDWFSGGLHGNGRGAIWMSGDIWMSKDGLDGHSFGEGSWAGGDVNGGGQGTGGGISQSVSCPCFGDGCDTGGGVG